MTKEEEKILLQTQVSEGDSAKFQLQAMEPYFVEKEKELFNAFCNSDANNKEQLVMIKLQHNVLVGEKSYFTNKIDSGRLAAKTLNNLLDKQA